MEIWGDGLQTRSILYVDECLEGARLLCSPILPARLNIGSEEMVTINQLAEMAMDIAGKKLNDKTRTGPLRR